MVKAVIASGTGIVRKNRCIHWRERNTAGPYIHFGNNTKKRSHPPPPPGTTVGVVVERGSFTIPVADNLFFMTATFKIDLANPNPDFDFY